MITISLTVQSANITRRFWQTEKAAHDQTCYPFRAWSLWPDTVFCLNELTLFVCGSGYRFSKDPLTYGPRKAILEAMIRLPWKAALLVCFIYKERQNNCQISKLETCSYWRYKGTYAPEKFRDVREILISWFIRFIRSELHIVIIEKTMKRNLKIGAANEFTIKTNTYSSGDT